MPKREWSGRWCVVQLDGTLYPQRFTSLSRARRWAKDWNNGWRNEPECKARRLTAVVRRFNRKQLRYP